MSSFRLPLRGTRPEKILVVNCGSSSLKYRLFDTHDETNDAHGFVERIGAGAMRQVHHAESGEVEHQLAAGDHQTAFAAMLSALCARGTGVIRDPAEVTLVAHRVVHGGEHFDAAVIVTDDVLRELDALEPLAPLHNPINLLGIRAAQAAFPGAPHVAVFDNAFHRTLPPHAYLYGLPYEYYEEKRVRRYGFHGTSHAYVCLAAAHFLERPLDELRLVSCHLGNGASVCAVQHGRSIDTSMGFTPGEGLIMGTRCGDLDPGVVTFLQRSEGMDAAAVNELLNYKSGLLGLSGISSDMREIEKAATAANPRAELSLEVFCYRVRKYIGAYIAALGGLDALVFTGGIGQGSARVRQLSLQGLSCLGIELDAQRNLAARGFEQICRISTDASAITLMVVPTDEERMMAREALLAMKSA